MEEYREEKKKRKKEDEEERGKKGEEESAPRTRAFAFSLAFCSRVKRMFTSESA